MTDILCIFVALVLCRKKLKYKYVLKCLVSISLGKHHSASNQKEFFVMDR